MFVRVRLYDTLRRFSNTNDRGIWEGEISEGSNIKELIKIIGIEEREIACAAIDKKVVPFDAVLKDNDKVMLVTNINGG
jgi:sulfur carrier protein ThiS